MGWADLICVKLSYVGLSSVGASLVWLGWIWSSWVELGRGRFSFVVLSWVGWGELG